MSITIAINFILASAYNFAHVVMIVSRELQNIWRKGLNTKLKYKDSLS